MSSRYGDAVYKLSTQGGLLQEHALARSRPFIFVLMKKREDGLLRVALNRVVCGPVTTSNGYRDAPSWSSCNGLVEEIS